jgi:hypothetical protein
LSERQDYWHRYGVFEDEDLESARKVGRWTPTYKGNAVVLPQDDPLILEWNLWEALYD